MDDQDKIRRVISHDVRVGGTAQVSLGGMRTATLKVVAIGKSGITTVDDKGSEYRFAWQHILGPAKDGAKLDDAKQAATAEAPDLTKAQAPEYRSVRPFDEVYFEAHDGQATHGVVASVGRHGATIDVTGEDGFKTEHKVTFAKIIGHRKKAERRLKILDQGEDGYLAEDETGARVFVRGKLESYAYEGLNKAMPISMAEPDIPSEWQGKVAQAKIIRDLAAAGFEPMMDFVRETFGPDYVFRTVETVPADDSAILAAIQRLSTQFQALTSSIHAMAARIATQGTEAPVIQIDNHLPPQPAPVVHVAPPEVTVAAPHVTLEMPAARRTVTNVEYDREGNIVRAVQEDKS